MQILPTLIAVVVLAVICLGIVAAMRLEKPWLQPIAIARAVVQLAILTVILLGIISNGLWVAAFLVVMVGAATWVVIRRLSLRYTNIPLIVGIITASTAIPVTVVFAAQAVPFSPRYVLAVGGIVVGNAMTACTLMGRSLGAAFVSEREQIEGWLALGATPRIAAVRSVRVAASTALIPATDQTRTTGIVTLPGAFVGAIFAGASPLGAAEFQILVLASVLVTGAIAVLLMSVAFGAPGVIPIGGRLRVPA
ncbi:MAG TPA: ABC transporter permease [Galbitalea sp.]|jgi:putative ABC transport system permease protein|nr:ABC transporter permease [Galbitalea sp.]